MKANVPGWGEVWFNPAAMMNIFSYAQMVDRYPVKYDNNKEDAFIVHLQHKQVKFTQENGIYVYRPPYVKQPAITKDNKAQCDNKSQPATKDNKVQCDKWQPMIKDNKVSNLTTKFSSLRQLMKTRSFTPNVNLSKPSKPVNYFFL
jgi:hypothetical protein